MKKLILLLAFIFVACTPDEQPIETPIVQDCYSVFEVGKDTAGSYILIGKNRLDPTDRERYKVANYLDWINRKQVCNLNEIK